MAHITDDIAANELNEGQRDAMSAMTSSATAPIGVTRADSLYVCFELHGVGFGVPMSLVKEIMLMPETIHVPLTPAAFVGLANMRGEVLPVLDLRVLLQFEATARTETTTAVVLDWGGASVGLMVDEIRRMNHLPEVEPSDDTLNIDSDAVCGVARDERTGEPIQLLDLHRIIPSDLHVPTRRRDDGAFGSRHDAGGLELFDDDLEEDVVQLVSFFLGEQEYALRVQDVREIVRMPETVSRVPRAMDHVLGLVFLRDQPLPLISLRQLLGMAPLPLEERNRVLVVGGECLQGRSLGVVVDRVQEVLRAPRQALRELPTLLSQHNGMREIDSICHLDEGERLVNVLKAHELCAHPAVEALMPGEVSDAEGVMLESDVADEHTGEVDLVVFRLGAQEFGVVVEHVQEIVRVPGEFNRLPQTPDFVDGLVNLRGAALPVLNMRARLGMERSPGNDRQRVLVFVVDAVRVGFVVDAVSEVLRVGAACIEDAPTVSGMQRRVMSQIINMRDDKRMIIVLNARELLSREEIVSIAA